MGIYTKQKLTYNNNNISVDNIYIYKRGKEISFCME